MDFCFFGTLAFWILGNACMLDFGYLRFCRSPPAPPANFLIFLPPTHTHRRVHQLPASQSARQPANCQAAGCWPLVEISKHKQANSTSLAYNQKPQPQLQQNGQAVVLGQWQNFQPSNLAGPAGRPSPNIEISATVQAPLLGHIVAAMVVASD